MYLGDRAFVTSPSQLPYCYLYDLKPKQTVTYHVRPEKAVDRLSKFDGTVFKLFHNNYLLDVRGFNGYGALENLGENWQHKDVQFLPVICSPDFDELGKTNKHLSSAELIAQSDFRKLMQFNFYMNVKHNKIETEPPEDHYLRSYKALLDDLKRANDLDLGDLLQSLNEQCIYYNLRPFTDQVTLFDDEGIFIIPVKTRTDKHACLSKATPVFAGRVHDVLKKLYGSASAPKTPNEKDGLPTL